MGKNCSKESWISFILRIAVASLFAVAAAYKFTGGLDALVKQFTGMFQNTFLPASLVAIYARILPWLEALIAVWLLIGIRLKAAWIVTAFTLISLSFGLTVAKQSPADTYVYIVIACLGIYFSEFDTCCIGAKGKNNH